MYGKSGSPSEKIGGVVKYEPKDVPQCDLVNAVIDSVMQ